MLFTEAPHSRATDASSHHLLLQAHARRVEKCVMHRALRSASASDAFLGPLLLKPPAVTSSRRPGFRALPSAPLAVRRRCRADLHAIANLDEDEETKAAGCGLLPSRHLPPAASPPLAVAAASPSKPPPRRSRRRPHRRPSSAAQVVILGRRQLRDDCPAGLSSSRRPKSRRHRDPPSQLHSGLPDMGCASCCRTCVHLRTLCPPLFLPFPHRRRRHRFSPPRL